MNRLDPRTLPYDLWVFDQVSQNVNLSKQDFNSSGIFHCSRGLNTVAMTCETIGKTQSERAAIKTQEKRMVSA